MNGWCTKLDYWNSSGIQAGPEDDIHLNSIFGHVRCSGFMFSFLQFNLSDGMYVRVHGHLKGFQGKKQLTVFSIR